MQHDSLIAAPKAKPDNFENSVIPLINIVFLLLIFFIIAGMDKLIEADIPIVNQAILAEKTQSKGEGAYLLIKQNGALSLNNSGVNAADLDEALSEISNERLIFLAVDKNTKALDVDPVLDALNTHQFDQVNLLVRTVENKSR